MATKKTKVKTKPDDDLTPVVSDKGKKMRRAENNFVENPMDGSLHILPLMYTGFID